MSLKLEIVTPEGIVWQNDGVLAVSIPTSTGRIEVLAGHIPLVSRLMAGYLTVTMPDGSVQDLAVDNGYVNISADTISIIAQAAVKIEDIDANAVEEAKEAALKALENAKNSHDDIEVERLEAIVRFAVAQELAKSKRNR